MITTPAVTVVLQDLVVEGTLTAAQATRVAERLASATDAERLAGATDGASLASATDAAATASGGAPAADPQPRPRDAGRLAEIAGYAGGALLLGAVALFLSNGWQDLSETSRVAILVSTSVLLIVAGGLIALPAGRALGSTRDSARRRLVSVLWTFAAGAAAGAAGLSGDHHELVAASAAGLVVAGLGYALVPSAVGQLGAWTGSVGLACGLVDEIGDDPRTTPYALVMLVVGALWACMALTRMVREREIGLALGAGLALFAAQLPVFSGEADELGYALTAAVAVAGFAGYLSARSWPVLGAGVLAMTLVVPEALNDWTDGSVSAAGSLLVAGLTLLGASAIGLRLRHEVG